MSNPWLANSCLLLLLASACPGSFSDNGYVSPPDPFIFIGDNLTLNCSVTNASITDSVSDSMYFIAGRDDELIPEEHIQITGPQSIQLVYPVTSPLDERTYSCAIRRTNESSDIILGSQYVSVEYPVLPVEGFACVVYNWESMNCSWNFQQNVVSPKRIKYTLVWTVRLSGGLFACPHNTTTSCAWWENDGEDSFKLEMHYILINTTVENRNGDIMEYKTKNVWIDPHVIVKPEPVQSLNIVNKSSSCISLTWEFNPPNIASMEYIIRLKHGVKEKVYLTRHTTADLCKLRPATTYTVGVAGKPIPLFYDKPTGFLSEETTITPTTLEDIPSGIPKVVLGGFHYYSERDSSDCSESSGTCRIRVFWKGLTKDESSGKITQYRIVLENRNSSDGHVENTTHGWQRSTDFLVDRNLEYKITFQAGTAVGLSSKSAVMFIPSLKERLSFPSLFVVEFKGNSLFITWKSEKDTDNTEYTLYTCTELKLNGTCKDELNWIHVSNSTSHELIYNSNDGGKLIGISRDLRTADQNLSSGIMWSSCLYQKDLMPLAPQIETVIQGENSLRAEWDAFGCTRPAIYVDKYILSYCMFKDGQCLDPVKNGTIDDQMMTKKRLDYTMENLTPWKHYRITLRAVSWDRVGPASEPKIVEVKNNNLSTGAVVGIAVAAVFIFIVLIALLLVFFKFCCQKFKTLKYDVDLPKIHDDGVPDRDMDKTSGKYTLVSGENGIHHRDLWSTDNDTNLIIESYQVQDDQKEKERLNSASSDKGSTNESYFKIGSPGDNSGMSTCESLLDSSTSKTTPPSTSTPVVQVFNVSSDPGYLRRITDHEPEPNTETADATSSLVVSSTYSEHLTGEECPPCVDMTGRHLSVDRNLNPNASSNTLPISTASHLGYLPNNQILPMASTMTIDQSGYKNHSSITNSPTTDSPAALAEGDLSHLAESVDTTCSETFAQASGRNDDIVPASTVTVSSSGYVSHHVPCCHQPGIQSQSDSYEQNTNDSSSFTSSNSLQEEKRPTYEISTPGGKARVTSSGYVCYPETVSRPPTVATDSNKTIKEDDEMPSLPSSSPPAQSVYSDAGSFTSTDSDPVASVTKAIPTVTSPSFITSHTGDYISHSVMYPSPPDADKIDPQSEDVVNTLTDSANPVSQGPSGFLTDTSSNGLPNSSNKDLPILSVKKPHSEVQDTGRIPLTSITSTTSDMSLSSPGVLSDIHSPTQHVFLRSISSDSGIDMDFIKKSMKTRPSLTCTKEQVEDELQRRGVISVPVN